MENKTNQTTNPIPITKRSGFNFFTSVFETSPIQEQASLPNSSLSSSSFTSDSNPADTKPNLPYRSQSLNTVETKRLAEKWGFSTVRRRSHTISNDLDITDNINQMLQRSKSPMRDMILNGQFLD